MGMFDVDMDKVVTSPQPYGYSSLPGQLAYAGAGGMVKAAGNALGFQDEEDLMQEIYDNADFTTMEGRQAAVAAVMKISPEKGAELQTQLNTASQAEASTNAMNIDVENSKIKRATALFTPML